MTRKDYVLIASAIKSIKDQYEGTKGHYADALLGDLTQRVADSLSNDNPRFDYSRFLAASGF